MFLGYDDKTVDKPVDELEKNGEKNIANIKIIGVGGAGGNTVASIIRSGVKNIESIIANTDSQAMDGISTDKKIVLGKSLTKGLGAGSNPTLGEKSAKESKQEIENALKGADLVFVAAGMGGGTGTGAGPVIANIAKDLGALVVGVVTTPFAFEGRARLGNAQIGVDKLTSLCDSMIVISNDRLLKQFGSIPIKDAFIFSDAVLKQSVRTITDLISEPALINLDFADIKTVMKNQGKALIGIGSAKGENKAKEAAENAITSALLDVSIKNAQQAIINVTGGVETSLEEAYAAVEIIRASAGNNINIVFGVSINDALQDEMVISVIATGLSDRHDESVLETITKKHGDGVLNFNTISNPEDISALDKNVEPEPEKELDDDELYMLTEETNVESNEEARKMSSTFEGMPDFLNKDFEE